MQHGKAFSSFNKLRSLINNVHLNNHISGEKLWYFQLNTSNYIFHPHKLINLISGTSPLVTCLSMTQNTKHNTLQIPPMH